MCQSLFLIKVQVFIKKAAPARVIFYEFWKNCQNSFSPQHLLKTASKLTTADW